MRACINIIDSYFMCPLYWHRFNNKSYAYCNNKSILDCIKNHIDSQYFLKLDICNFFNSISKRNLNKILKMVLSDNGSEMYISNLTGKTAIYKSSIINKWNEVEKITWFIFCKWKIVTGVSIISNFVQYLYGLILIVGFVMDF